MLFSSPSAVSLNRMPASPARSSTLALLVSLAVVSVVSACDKPAPKAFVPPPTQVGVVTVAPTDIPEPYEFVGQVAPFRRVEVRSRVDGIVTDRPFTEGSFVHKGQVLYKLDVVKYDAAYRSAVARFDNAKRTLARLEPLVPKHAVAQQDVDNARMELASARAQLAEAQRDFADTFVRAELDGRIGRTLLDVGARVTGPSDLLTTIDQLAPVYVSFRPSSDQVLEWTRLLGAHTLASDHTHHLSVEAILPDGSKVPRSGRVDFVASAVDASTGTQDVRALFENYDLLLVPGQFVRARLVGLTAENALTVPPRAVQTTLGRQFVYVVAAGDTVRARDIETEDLDGKRRVVRKGLRAGDRVVIDGIQRVVPDRPVRATPWKPGTEASSGTGT